MNYLSVLLSYIRGMWANFKKWLSLWPDSLALPLALLGFWISIPVLRWIDPTSGIFDTGIFQIVIVVAVILTALNALVFLGLEFNFPMIWDWYKKDILKRDWLSIAPWQRLSFFFLLYFGLFVLSVWIVTSLI
jgi:hypothetical protein